MKQRECVVCGGNSVFYCGEGDDVYHICENCGLIFERNIVKTDLLYKTYSGGIVKSLRRRMFSAVRKLWHDKDYKFNQARAAEWSEFMMMHFAGANRSYFDIGCNNGFLVEAMIKQGFDSYGNEIVPELMRPFVNTYPDYRDHIYSGRFEDISSGFQSESLGVISAIDVVEHFEDIRRDLGEIHRILSRDGIFVVQTPDTSSSDAIKKTCGWGALKTREHINLFNPDNFSILANQIGFSKVEIYPQIDEADGNFVAILRKI